MFTRKNQKKPVEPANCILFFFCVLRTRHVCPKSIHEDSYTSLSKGTYFHFYTNDKYKNHIRFNLLKKNKNYINVNRCLKLDYENRP